MQVLKEGEKVPDFKTVFKKIILGDQKSKDLEQGQEKTLEHDDIDSPKVKYCNVKYDINGPNVKNIGVERDVDSPNVKKFNLKYVCSPKVKYCNVKYDVDSPQVKNIRIECGENISKVKNYTQVDSPKLSKYNLEHEHSSDVQKDMLGDVESHNEKQPTAVDIINSPAKHGNFSKNYEEFTNKCKQKSWENGKKYKVKMKQTDEIVERINHILDKSSCFSLKKKLPDAYYRNYGQYKKSVSQLTHNKFSKIFEGSGINPYSSKATVSNVNNVSEFCTDTDYIFSRKYRETFTSGDKAPSKEEFCIDSRQTSRPNCFYYSKSQGELADNRISVQNCHHSNEFSQNACSKLLESLSVSSSHQVTELNISKSNVLEKEHNMPNSSLLNISENDNQHFSEEWEIDEYLGVYGAPPEKILAKFPRRSLR